MTGLMIAIMGLALVISINAAAARIAAAIDRNTAARGKGQP